MDDGRPFADKVASNFKALDLEGLVVIGGDGTQAIGYRLMTDYGIPVVGVPKTIDNDLSHYLHLWFLVSCGCGD